jgi:hypothetical protein
MTVVIALIDFALLKFHGLILLTKLADIINMLNVAVLESATDLPVNVHASQVMKERVAPVHHVLTLAPDMAHAHTLKVRLFYL